MLSCESCWAGQGYFLDTIGAFGAVHAWRSLGVKSACTAADSVWIVGHSFRILERGERIASRYLYRQYCVSQVRGSKSITLKWLHSMCNAKFRPCANVI